MEHRGGGLNGGDRILRLTRSRALKMARSTHAYVRGNTAKFYDWLAKSRSAAHLPDGPSCWICGDAHLGNLGPIAAADGQIDIQIRDLDQSVIGNPAHDLIRLGLSLASAARGSDLPGVTTARMIEEMVDGYARAMARPITEGEEGETPEPNVVKAVKRQALGRRWRHLLSRMDDSNAGLPRGKKFWPLEEAEGKALKALLKDPAVIAMVLALNHRDEGDKVRLLDAAFWKKGCSSLGNLRYAALLGIGGTRKQPADYALIDLKEAVTAVAPSSDPAAMPADHAQRVVAGALALAPNLGERMLATHVLGRPMVMRELLPQDLKLEVAQFSRGEATKAARYLAYVVGLAHARQMDREARRWWQDAVRRRQSATLDAPGWLWESVVDLTGVHEAAYLEHCRAYALSAQEG